MKILTQALIEIIRPSQLQIGDYILWSNLRRKVIDINRGKGT